MANLTLSAFSDEYSDSLIEQLKALNNFDIKFMEMRGVDGKNVSTLNAKEVLEIKNKIEDFDIKISSIGSPIGKIKLEDDFLAHLESAKKIFDTANVLNTKNIRIFSFYLPDGIDKEDCKNEVLDKLFSLITLADSFGVTLCHENEALIYGESPEKCLELLKCFNGKLRAVFDMGNFVLDGYDPIKAYNLLFDHIEYFHIKDALKAGAIVPAGKGEAQIKYILDDYKTRSNRDTFITLEPHLQTFSGLNALVGKSFENPYKYNDQKEAFYDAVDKLRAIL